MEKTYHVRTQQLKNPVGQNSVSSTPTKGRKEYWSVEGSIGIKQGSIGRGGIGMVLWSIGTGGMGMVLWSIGTGDMGMVQGGEGVTGGERIAGEVICEVAKAKIQ